MKRVNKSIFANNSYLKNAVFLALIILVSATLFRITYSDLIEFKTDEALSILLSARPLFGHTFPPGATVSSVGIMNPPLVNYLLLPLVSISLDPRIISILIGFINSIAIAGFFLIVNKYYGTKTALFTALLLSFSTWSILLSRKIWNPDLVLPVFLLLFFSIHKLIIERKEKYWSVYFFSCLLLIQVHLDTIFFVAPLTVFLLTKFKTNLKYISFGILLGIIPLIPYLWYQFLNNCPDCVAFINSRNKLSTHHYLETLIKPFQIVGLGDFRFVIGNDTLTFQNLFPLPYFLRKLLYIEYLVLPLAVFSFFKIYPKMKILVFTSLLVPFLYFFLKVEPLIHYYDILLPILFLFIGAFFNFLTNSKNNLIKILSYTLFLSMILVFIVFNIFFFKLLSVKQNMDGDYGPVYSLRKKVAEDQFAKYKDDPAYQEMYLTSFVPQSLFHGNLPMAKIFFDLKNTQKNLLRLEKRLQSVPVDPRVQYELIAYYSQKPPTLVEVKYLRNIAVKSPIYFDVYREIYANIYLPQHFKNEYYSKSLGLSFDYPKHWIVKEGENNLLISGDSTSLTISTTEPGTIITINDKTYYLKFYPKETATIKELIESMR